MTKKEDTGELPGIVEGTLQFFEGLAGAGKSRVSFAFVTSQTKLPCNFCGERTAMRLSFELEGETNTINVCEDCKAGITHAGHDHE